MGVKPMSPSANFTTYNLPPSGKNDSRSDAFGHHSYALSRPKAASNGLFRFLLCSRPCFQQSVDIDQDDATVDLEDENARSSNFDSGSIDEDWNLRMELQAVMRHLEVRWQLFDEALSRFRDLEAMLAICADKVRWRHYTANGAKEVHVAADLKSLISRKLSMEVSIHRITQLSSSGELGISFTRNGYCGQLQPKERVLVQAALDLFNESREGMRSDRLRNSRLCVLEEDDYIFCNQRVSSLLAKTTPMPLPTINLKILACVDLTSRVLRN
ncbi:hypothetical protein M758_3G155800 [Ceratodon purpureus]|nr:hypothetical protein M758_3G155800 [Ceratodon purpureus]